MPNTTISSFFQRHGGRRMKCSAHHTQGTIEEQVREELTAGPLDLDGLCLCVYGSVPSVPQRRMVAGLLMTMATKGTAADGREVYTLVAGK